MKYLDFIFLLLISGVLWCLFATHSFQLNAAMQQGEVKAAASILNAGHQAGLALDEVLRVDAFARLDHRNKNSLTSLGVVGLIQTVGFVLLQLLLVLWYVARYFYIKKPTSTQVKGMER